MSEYQTPREKGKVDRIGRKSSEGANEAREELSSEKERRHFVLSRSVSAETFPLCIVDDSDKDNKEDAREKLLASKNSRLLFRKIIDIKLSTKIFRSLDIPVGIFSILHFLNLRSFHTCNMISVDSITHTRTFAYTRVSA